MLDKIKRYELSDSADIELLKEAGFREVKLPFKKKIVLFQEQFLKADITLNISITLNNDGSLYFDDFESVNVIDDEFLQPYTPFYGDNEFKFLNEVIDAYNNNMDILVTIGILKEKEIEKQKVKTK